jgi:hypothetical protein
LALRRAILTLGAHAGATLGHPLLELLLLARRERIPFGLQPVAQSVLILGTHRIVLGAQLVMKCVPLILRHRRHLIAMIASPHHRQLGLKEMVSASRSDVRPLVARGRRAVLARRRRAILTLVRRWRAVLALVGWRRRVLRDRNTRGTQEQAGAQTRQQQT